MVEAALNDGDSVGGLIEVVAEGVPAGLGDPVFHKLEASLGGAVLSIGAVKGVEFGAGFSLVARRGSEANDQMSAQGFLSNTAGGILGVITGISDHYAIVKIADNTEIKIQKSSVAQVVPKDTFDNA